MLSLSNLLLQSFVKMVAFKLVQLAALVASILPASTSALASPPTYGQLTPKPRDGRWVDTWGSMPQLTEPANLPPPPFVRITQHDVQVQH